jgi:hypothetical protein
MIAESLYRPDGGDLPPWMLVAGTIALVAIAVLLWRARGSLSGDGRGGFPDDPPRDTSDYHGPRSGVATFIGSGDDPGHTKPRGRDDPDP